jgi:hypothetical protein
VIKSHGASSDLERKRRDENKSEDKGYIYAGFFFAGQNTIECVVGFRIDSYTIKRGTL